MESQKNDPFLRNLTAMYETARQPAVVVDGEFVLIWASSAAIAAQPRICLPDGIHSLLSGFDFEQIKSEIAQYGSFTTPAGEGFFMGPSILICALADKSSRYLLQTAPIPSQGSGLRPEGISRTISTFTSQYRTPLTLIFSMLTLLGRCCKEGAAPEDLQNASEYLAAIRHNAYKLLRSCQWITEYTTIAHGLSEPKPQRVELYDFLRQFFDAAAQLTASADIPLQYELPDGQVFTACDTEKLSTILLNILSNSCRFTRPGNHILIKVRRRRASVSISVVDRGLGIPAEARGRVFEPYFTCSPEGRPIGGTGLGLAIARDAVSAMGGAMSLTSSEGRGTTVLFSLPLCDGDETLPDAIFCSSADYLCDPFSPLYVALSDSIPPPL